MVASYRKDDSMKRNVVLFFISLALLVNVFGAEASAASVVTTRSQTTLTMDVDFSEAEEGIVYVLYNTGKDIKVKLSIQEGDDKYYYNLDSSEEYVAFPLQFGDGDYTIKILENTSGSSYRRVLYKKVAVDIEDEVAVFLQSNQQVTWDVENEAIVLAEELVQEAYEVKNEDVDDEEDFEALTEDEIIEVLYTYVIENIAYDYDKIETLSYDYIPEIDQVLEDGDGICYDYSVLFASMLRSQGIPAKLIKGYTSLTDAYHAWNQVYIDEEWVVIDTTFDAYYLANDTDFEMVKDSDDYETSKEF